MKLTADLQKELGSLIQSDAQLMEFIRHRLFEDLWLWNPEDPVSEWKHPRFGPLLGYPAPNSGETVAINWEQTINQDDLQQAVLELKQYLQKPGSVFEQTIRYHHKNGAIVWLKFYLIGLRNAEGQLHKLVGAYEDISLLKNWHELQQAIEQAKESEEKYRTIFEKNKLVSLAINPDNGDIIDANEAAAEFYGYPCEELLSMNIKQINTLTPEEIKKEMQLALLEKRNYFIFKHRLASGEIRNVEVYSTPIVVKEKQYLHSQIHDITEKIRAREKADRSNQINVARIHLLEFSYNHSMEALLEESLNQAELITGSKIGFYHFVNEDQKSLTLQNWSTNTKKLFCQMQPAERHYDIDSAGVWVDCVYQRKPVIHDDYSALAHRKGLPPGHTPVMRELVVPVIQAQKVMAIMGVGNKDQPYHQMDVEAIEQLASLSFEIIQRKRMEEAHLKNETRLEALNQTKDRLMSVIGHDVKGPVGSILGISHLMLENRAEETDTRELKFLKAINNAASNTMELLENLLIWARSQTGETIWAIEKIHLQSFAENIIQTFTPAMTLKNIRVNIQIPDSLQINADSNLLGTVLRNLLSNAIKYSCPKSTIEIFTRLTQDNVELSVKDYGTGMCQETLDNLFNYAKTVSLSGTANEKGSGLGLILCKEFTEKQGGTLKVESQLNTGTTFTLSLPL